MEIKCHGAKSGTIKLDHPRLRTSAKSSSKQESFLKHLIDLGYIVASNLWSNE